MRRGILLALAVGLLAATLPPSSSVGTPSRVQVLLRFEGHTVKAIPGPSRPCRRDPCRGPVAGRFPAVPGGWVTVIAPRTLRSVTLQLGRVTSRGYRAVGESVEARRSTAKRRWRVTLPRRLGRANTIDVVTTDASGRVRSHHAYLTR